MYMSVDVHQLGYTLMCIWYVALLIGPKFPNLWGGSNPFNAKVTEAFQFSLWNKAKHFEHSDKILDES